MSRPPANGFRNMSTASIPSVASAGPSQQRLAAPVQHQRPISPGAGSGSSPAMSRAERFEDEKRRIIESCFSKLDANGQLAESYITHIRILEDAQYPSAPPPPESAENNKKPRLIIIAVRSTGRVRMHKARENSNGSFSIGKTWNLEEMSAIEVYGNAGVPVQTEKDALHRTWAGGVGFTVTITKPYYWQAGTSKEKDFFIASAVKIYRKYTKGQVPELKGFEEREKAVMLGAMPAQQQQQQPPPQQPSPASVQSRALSPGMRAESRAESRADSRDLSPVAPPQPPFAARPQSREESRYRQSPGPPPSLHDARPGSAMSRQHSESPAPHRHPSGTPQPQPSPLAAPIRPFASQEHMRAGSRDGRPPERRPGTSPGPGQGRTPPPQQQQVMPPPSLPSVRSDSPGVSSLASSVGPGRPQVRAVSPAQSRGGYQHPVSSVPEDRSVDSGTQEAEKEIPAMLKPGGAAAGASLFASTRQRWQQHQNPQPSQSQGAPQLPPIETSQPMQPDQQRSAGVWHPKTAASEASSAGIDLDDAAAVQALTNYWGPEPTPAAPTPPAIHEPSSPPTPERSTKRPPFSERNQSEASFDLRPQPLRSGGRTPDDRSDYGTLQDGSKAPSAVHSAQPTPRTEEPPAIKPLAVRDKRQSQEPKPQDPQPQQQEPKPSMPGAFTPTLGPSPSGTPAATPGDEPNEEDLARQQAEREREIAEAYRPGLGPMIKKNNVRDRFKKAATAAQAFKPRPGGAAEKIMRAKADREAGTPNGDMDGVSGFVPRPAPAPVVKEEPAVPEPVAVETAQEVSRSQDGTPTLEITSPLSPGLPPIDSPGIMAIGQSQSTQGVKLHDASPSKQPRELLQTPDQQAQQDAEDEAERSLFEQREARKPQVKVKRRSNTAHRNLAAMGVDPTLLEGKALEFEATLVDFGWTHSALEPKKLVEFEVDLRREQGRLEAGSWLSHADPQRDEKVAQVESLLDKAIAECDDLEGLLTLYSVELGSLNEDIAFIEAQSQGLQVQSANQKGLLRELESLVDTMSLDRKVLEPLRYGDLGDTQGLEQVEGSLIRLYQAMITIDPSIRSAVHGGRSKSRLSSNSDANDQLSSMKALREKREVYDREAAAFVQRLMQHLDYSFTTSLNEARDRAMRPTSGGAKRMNKDAFTDARRGLWVYSPLMLFTKELNAPAWGTLLRVYYSKAQPLYGDVFKENLAGWKRAARKPGADEAELLFTATEKDEGSTGGAGLGAARKLTIKRSQTLAKTLRNASGGKSPTESRTPGQLLCSEAFGGAMDEMAPLISQEQNFVVDLFHASSLEPQDFLEAVNATPPSSRHGTNLLQPRPMDPDRELAKQVTGIMDNLFGFFAQDMGTMLEWAVSGDPIQGVGVMACLSRHAYYLQETSQEFLLQLLEGLTSRLQNLWSKFVDEQVRAIEDTKVKIKKRKGVINFMKVFPHFAAAVENVFSAVAREDYEKGEAGSMYEVRRLVDETYGRINRAMFDSLKVIAKESPMAGQTAAAAAAAAPARMGEDPEDKERLNFHILLIENMNHYVEEVDDGGKEGVLAEWRGKALLERAEALEGYVGRVVKRPLGKLLDFLDSTDSLLTSHPTNPTAIASRPSYSRKAARNLFAQYDGKEVRRGIDTLRKRIEKHFGDADEEVLSRNLVGFVGKECERAYERTIERMERLVREVYPPQEGEKAVEVDFSREDVRAGFRR